MKRVTVPDAETFIAAIQDELSRTREGRYFHRLAVVLHVLRGASAYEASRAFGFSSRAIEYWVNRLASNGLNGLWTGSIPDGLAVFPPRKCKDYEENYSVLPGILVSIKTFGTVCYCRITWKRTTPFHSVYDNAKDFFTRWDSVSKGHVAKLLKPILSSKSPLKKLQGVDERPHDPTLVRGPSSFSATQQPNKNVGSKRATATRILTFSPPQSRFFRSTQSKNRSSTHARGSHFQFRDLWRFYPLSTRIYSWENIPYSGQCQMAQIEGFEKFFRVQSRPSGTNLPSTIFTRTQSRGTSLANYSSAGNSQPLFPVGRRPQNRFSISIYEMGAAE